MGSVIGYAVQITVGFAFSCPFDPSMTLRVPLNVSRLVITANGCRWFRTIWVRLRGRSTACRRFWLSGRGVGEGQNAKA